MSTELTSRDVEERGLESSFAPPHWLRDLGRTSWLLVGFAVLLVGFLWLLGATATIVGPLVAAGIIATVAMPVVASLERHRVRRIAGAAIVLLALVTLAVVVLLVVLGGIKAQSSDISQNASAAADKLQSWAESLGVDESAASSANSSASSAAPAAISTLTTGVVDGIEGIASLLFGLSLAALSLFLLLKDGPSMRRFVDGHLGVPKPIATTITGNLIRSLRGYFRGVTIIAAFNATVVGIASVILGVPLAGTIALVTFICAYVPYIGAFVAGTFAVLIALGSEGTTTAAIMLVVVLLANGLLQNIVQPFAMGASLGLNPLVVLVVTIGAGCVLGMVGLVLAAPLTSAAVHIARDLRRARASGSEEPAAATAASGWPWSGHRHRRAGRARAESPR
jgi:putative heme transporter